ncbi:phage tail fiber domain-containing protein [Pseudomonas asgharzadehiana]|uniref:Mannuronan 5-epimerase n=1 Tax=Pseudomonas asgharzadehiana TaxID=2842349 RepID=A0ABX8P4Y1_9PSED|nr:phage tail fiber protein [Pseudomonas asgharzadehiana]QXH68614.1 hypothetical protein KSS96_06695 [Pseudomonas asgharzadehiana]
MTVNTIDSIAEFDTNGVTTNFPFYFKFLANEDLVVTYVNPAGVSSTLTLGSQYTVNGAGNDAGGSIVTTSALAGPGQLVVSREMLAYQQTSLRNQGKFLAETHEDVFDRLTMLFQQGLSIAKRALMRKPGTDYFDAENRNISNLADPVAPKDAVNKGWLATYLEAFTGAIVSTASIPYDTFTLFDFLRFWNARAVDSIAELRLLSSARNQKAHVYGYYDKGDGGGGYYYVDTTDTTSADNGGTVIVGIDGARWKSSRTRVVTLRQFGAKGIGTDDTAAMQAAIYSGAKKVKYGSGTYGVGAAGLTGVASQIWEGDGDLVCILKMLVPPTLDMVYIQQKTNFDISGICFDGNGQLTAGVGHFPSLLPCVHISECSQFKVVDCRFIGFYNMGLLANVVSKSSIRGNHLDRGGNDTFINHGIGVSGESSDMRIEGNRCYYCQISVNAINTIIDGNIVTGWGFSAGINTQATSSCYNLTITNNICHDSRQEADVSPYWPQGIENWAPNSIITGNICYGNFGDGIGNGGKNCLIANNICYNNRSYGIFNAYQDATYNASGTLVVNNKMYDTRVGGFRYQQGGYAEQPGGLTGIMFSDNQATNNIGANVFNCTDRATAAQYDWIPITVFTNSWLDYGGGTFSPVSYYKDTDGIVHLRGAIKSGTVAAAAFLLPAGFRPAGNSYFPCVSNNAFGFFNITTGGGVVLQVGSNSYASLDGISFRAA